MQAYKCIIKNCNQQQQTNAARIAITMKLIRKGGVPPYMEFT